jgi:hypothetical protein
MYMRPEADRIWPHDRVLPSRSGAVGSQVARTAAKTSKATMPPRKRPTVSGLRRSRMSPFELVATAVQKKSVALVPNVPPVGTA